MKEADDSNLDINTSTTENDDVFTKMNLVNPDENAKKATIENVSETGELKGKAKSKSNGTIGKKGGGTMELSPDCTIGAEIAPSELLKDIMSIKSEEILQPLLNTQTYFFRKIPVEKVLKWQKREIHQPLLKMDDENGIEAAKQMFRNLLSYMDDRKSSKRPILHVKKIIRIVLVQSPIVRDEAYLQVYKQLHDNPKHSSLMKGWKEMAIISSCFVPSNKDIYYLILNFLFFEMKNNKDPQILNHVKYIFVRMIKMKNRARRHVPSEEELECIEKLLPIDLPVKFFTGHQTMIKIESYTTIRELKMELMKRLDFNIQRAVYYAIYEICEKNSGTEERFIDDSDRVCDILSVWNSEMTKEKKNNGECHFHFYLKLLIYYPFEKDDIDTLSVVYHQTVYDVLSGKHPLEERKIIALAAYQLVNEYQDDEDEALKRLNEHLEKYIPNGKIHLKNNEEWVNLITEEYKKVNDIKSNDAKWEYISQLESLPTYQVQQFNAKYNMEKSGTNEDEIPEKCVVGIKPDGIIIMDRNRNEVVFYKYETIMNWGISKNQLIICISTGVNEIKRVCFFTSQTKTIQTLMEVYCNLLIGKSIKDVQEVVKNYDTKFNKIDTSMRRASLMYKEEQQEDVLGINDEGGESSPKHSEE